jgi:hypothetical protein
MAATCVFDFSKSAAQLSKRAPTDDVLPVNSGMPRERLGCLFQMRCVVVAAPKLIGLVTSRMLHTAFGTATQR